MNLKQVNVPSGLLVTQNGAPDVAKVEGLWYFPEWNETIEE